MLNIRIQQGKGRELKDGTRRPGRWRWLAYDGDVCRATGRIRGHETREQAERSAKNFFGQSATLYTEEDGELFAGERDFSN